MRPGKPVAERAIALVMVMIVIVVLSILAGGFAYSMKVETRLARNADGEVNLEWMARSCVARARWILVQQLQMPNQPYDSLNQSWAGGPGVTNGVQGEVELDLLDPTWTNVTLRIVDQERKFNINVADEAVIQQALMLVGVDAGEFQNITDAIMDWRDADDDPRLSGAESDYYLGLSPPYAAKNGPFDDISELQLIRGITPEVYWGFGSTNLPAHLQAPRSLPGNANALSAARENSSGVGLADIFSTVSFRTININTASRETLQMIPEVDATIAEGILARRAGPDGLDGTEDDDPFQNVSELVNVPGMNQAVVSQLGRYCGVRSYTFEVRVGIDFNGLKRDYVALVHRRSSRDVQLLHFYWK